MNIRMQNVREDDAEFLYRIMNDKKILDALDEIPTQFNDWVDAISAWNCDPDEEDYRDLCCQSAFEHVEIEGFYSGGSIYKTKQSPRAELLHEMRFQDY